MSPQDHHHQDAPSARPAQAWQRWLRSEVPTAPIQLVDRLRGTPYRDPSRMDSPADDEARAAVDFALRLGDLLFRSGAGTRAVETSLIAVTAALGLRDVEVDITSQSMLVQHAPAGGPPLTMVRVARTASRDYARLAAAHQLVADLVAGTVSRTDAVARLEQVEQAAKPWPRWVVTVAFGVLGAAVCALVGGGLAATAWSFVVSALIDRVGRLLGRRGVPEFFTTAVGAAVASVATVLLVHSGLLTRADAGAVIAGGIVVLLPGRLLVSALEDAISGFTLTAAGRVLSVLLVGAGIISGVAVGLGLARRWGLALDVDAVGVEASDVLRGLAASAVASLATAVAYRSRRSHVLPAVGIGVVTYAVLGGLRLTGLAGPTAATAAAAAVAGLLARLLAGRVGAPALVLSVPALSALLPGLMIFRAMSAVADGASDGVLTLFGAATVALAVGAGVVLGDGAAAPVDRWLLRRRLRRHLDAARP